MAEKGIFKKLLKQSLTETKSERTPEGFWKRLIQTTVQKAVGKLDSQTIESQAWCLSIQSPNRRRQRVLKRPSKERISRLTQSLQPRVREEKKANLIARQSPKPSSRSRKMAPKIFKRGFFGSDSRLFAHRYRNPNALFRNAIRVQAPKDWSSRGRKRRSCETPQLEAARGELLCYATASRKGV